MSGPRRRWPGGGPAVWVPVALLLVLPAAPLAVLGVQATSRGWFYPQVLPREWTAEAVSRLVTDPGIRDALATGLVVSLAATTVAMLLGVPAARALGTRRFPGRGLALAVLALPLLVPPPAVGIGLNVAFLRAGLAGDTVGVVLAHLVPTVPYVVFPLLGAFARYDEGIELQARSLGAGPLTVAVRVSLPLLAPALAVAALFGFLASWGQYTLTLLIGGGRVVTLPVLLVSTATGGDPAVAATLALALAGPAVLAVALAVRVARAVPVAAGGTQTDGGVR